MPYIASTMTKAHVAMLDVVADKVFQKIHATGACIFVIQYVLLTHPSKIDLSLPPPTSPILAQTNSFSRPRAMNPLIYLAVLLLTLAIWFKMRSTDPYGLFHLTLNKLPSESPNSPPLTEWLNMGYWKVGPSPTLCSKHMLILHC